ncbi:GAF and ANTAR domain-containing protein [Amycolatopsis sp. NPDC089917]|uniref:GAF and ANTAR domain-containing protein n=1 Tax=Amycolatopsis sp. NPDC089917 TaxID=3155187 RepID=UPI00343EB4F8
MPTTERELLIAEAVRDLADRHYDANPLELLNDLTAHVVTLLPADSASVTVTGESGQVDYLAASDETSRRLEQDQLDLNDGPSVDGVRTRAVLWPVALDAKGPAALRWPRFTPRALRAGVVCVATVPLRTRDRSYGVLSLMTTTSPVPAHDDVRLAQTLASTAAIFLRQRRVLFGKDTVIGQLTTALRSRVVIEQAKGVLSERLQIPLDEAFVHLRGHARSKSRKLRDLAAEVAEGTIPAELDTTR